jgi:hypothetical protein
MEEKTKLQEKEEKKKCPCIQKEELNAYHRLPEPPLPRSVKRVNVSVVLVIHEPQDELTSPQKPENI